MSPLPSDDRYDGLVEIRGYIIEQTAELLETLVLAPRLTHTQIDRMVGGVRPLVDAFRKSVETAHTSSSASYSMTDLPKPQKEAYDRAEHALRLLDALYGPKVAPAGVGG